MALIPSLGQVGEAAARIARQPYPLGASLWLALIFSERLLVHRVVYDRDDSLLQAAFQSATVFCLLVTWLLFLVALLVDREATTRLLNRVGAIRRQVFHEIVSPLGLVLIALGTFVVLLARGATTNQTIVAVAAQWWTAFVESLEELVKPAPVTVLGGVVLLYLIWLVVARYLRRRDKPVEEAIYELIVAAFLVASAAVFFLWLNVVSVLPPGNSVLRTEALSGLVKDTIFYALIALTVVGMSKVGDTLRAMRTPIRRWQAVRTIGWGLLVGTTVALAGDLFYRECFLPSAAEYPDPRQKQIIRAHIMIRDFGMCLPLLAAASIRMFRDVERVNLAAAQERRERKRQTD